MRTKFSRSTLVGACALLVGGTVGIGATPAAAIAANCKGWKETIERNWTLDDHRAAAFCYSMDADTRVRAKLDRTAGPDYFSTWLYNTTVNTTVYTGWYTCYQGCVARLDITSR